MPMRLEDSLRQTDFLLRKCPLTEGWSFPAECDATSVSDDEGIIDRVSMKPADKLRTIVIVGEDDFVATIKLLRERSQVDKDFHFALVAVSREPAAFLEKRAAFPELVDVVSPTSFKGMESTIVLRSVRHMVKLEELGKPRASQKTLLKLNEIFIALSAERNPKQLLATILLQAMDMTNAEGGLLYMIEEHDGEISFRLRISKGLEKEVVFCRTTERVSETSITGYVALTGKSVNIRDLENLRPYQLPVYSPDLDFNEGKPHTVLTVPLQNRQNEIIAVLQLVNKRSEDEGPEIPPAPFDPEDEGLLSSFGTQAAICLENVDLYGDIQKLFDGFVKAAITAIESRDPSTGGHSERVAQMSVALARATNECQVGIYRSVSFKDEEIMELNYAALLHDFGKIGVREEVLVKAKKLYPYQLDAIHERLKICKAAAKIKYVEALLKKGKKEDSDLYEIYQKRIRELDSYWQIIVTANEPSVLKASCAQELERISNEQLILEDNSTITLLNESEFTALSVQQGSLTESERLEVESHVRHTYQFLKMIPWTRDFKHLTQIAYSHHEKLDGTGYPRGLTSHEIPLQGKIMTIVDIFDALTAADRWYKDAVPTEKAIEIIGDEVSQGKLDPVLYELFVEKKIYELNTTTPMSDRVRKKIA